MRMGPSFPAAHSRHRVSGEGASPGEVLTRDDADGDVHVVDLLGEGGRHHACADQQAAQHHHRAVSKPAAQDRGERGCRGERAGLSPQDRSPASPGVCLFTLLLTCNRVIQLHKCFRIFSHCGFRLHCSWWDLSSPSGTEPGPPAGETQSPNPWTTGSSPAEVPHRR